MNHDLWWHFCHCGPTVRSAALWDQTILFCFSFLAYLWNGWNLLWDRWVIPSPFNTLFKHACWFNPRKTTCVPFRSFPKVRSFFSDVYGVTLRCLPALQVGAKPTLLNVLDLRCSKGQGLESSDVLVFTWSQGLILLCLGPRPSHSIGATVHRNCKSFRDSLTWKLLEDTSNFYKRFHFFPTVFRDPQ